MIRALSLFVPKRVANRPSVQILRAQLAVALRQRTTAVGPGVPIVGVIKLDNADWRRDVALLLWMLAQEAIVANDRLAWLICVGLPDDEPLEDLYALAVQAEPIVQLHVMREQTDLDKFCEQFVPPSSLEEIRQRPVPDFHAVLARISVRPGAFGRVTSARSAAHTLVKQLSMGQLAVAVDVSQVRSLTAAFRQNGSVKLPVRVLVTGDPLQLLDDAPEHGDIVLVRRLGLSFLDELAVIRVCDAYIGTCDHNALVAADAGVPCLLRSEGTAEYENRILCVSEIGPVSGDWIRALLQRAGNPFEMISTDRIDT